MSSSPVSLSGTVALARTSRAFGSGKISSRRHPSPDNWFSSLTFLPRLSSRAWSSRAWCLSLCLSALPGDIIRKHMSTFWDAKALSYGFLQIVYKQEPSPAAHDKQTDHDETAKTCRPKSFCITEINFLHHGNFLFILPPVF